jgi:purine-binding chemotaxis protein CheW
LNGAMRFLLCTIDDARYAVPSDAVLEIVRAVAITPLPNAPGVIEGVIDVRGSVTPVFDLRERFGLPRREVALSDHFVVVRGARRTAALHVDRALDLVDVDEQAVTTMGDRVRAPNEIAGVVTLADGLAVIHDVDTFLSRAEEESLDAALDAGVHALADAGVDAAPSADDRARERADVRREGPPS